MQIGHPQKKPFYKKEGLFNDKKVIKPNVSLPLFLDRRHQVN